MDCSCPFHGQFPWTFIHWTRLTRAIEILHKLFEVHGFNAKSYKTDKNSSLIWSHASIVPLLLLDNHTFRALCSLTRFQWRTVISFFSPKVFHLIITSNSSHLKSMFHDLKIRLFLDILKSGSSLYFIRNYYFSMGSLGENMLEQSYPCLWPRNIQFPPKYSWQVNIVSLTIQLQRTHKLRTLGSTSWWAGRLHNSSPMWQVQFSPWCPLDMDSVHHKD